MVPLPEASTPSRTDPAAMLGAVAGEVVGAGFAGAVFPGAVFGVAPGPTGARYQRRRVPMPAPGATLPGASGGRCYCPGHRDRGDVARTGLPPVNGPTSLGPPCPGSAPRDSGIGTAPAFPKRNFGDSDAARPGCDHPPSTLRGARPDVRHGGPLDPRRESGLDGLPLQAAQQCLVEGREAGEDRVAQAPAG